MPHRLFIAINLPPELKEKLLSFQTKWPEIPARWLQKENLHITLVFLGYLKDEEVVRVCQIVRDIVSKYQPFSINLTKICYGPPKKSLASETNRPPKMVWAQGERVKELADIKDALEKALSKEINFISEERGFSPHITLARIKTWLWRQIEQEERPEVNEEIFLSFPVATIEVMESQLRRGGAEYTILESAPLGRF